MKKLYIIFALLAVTSMVLAGCKPKEKVPVSTTAATEAPTTTAAPTEPPTTQPTTKAPLESIGESLEEDNVKIHYPRLTGLDDVTILEKVNSIIKDTTASAADGFGIDKEKNTVVIDYEVKSLNQKKMVSIFTVKKIPVDNTAGAVETTYEYYLTIDLTTGKTVRLTDYIDPTALGEILISGSNYGVISDDSSQNAKIKKYLSGVKIKTYEELFINADFSGNSLDPFPKVFSYDDNGTIVLLVPVSEELGGYATLSYTPSTK